MSYDVFNDQRLEKEYQKIKAEVMLDKYPEDHPLAVVLGGLPGSGKSNIYEFYNIKKNDNMVQLDCDKFRKYHPDASSFTPDEYAEKTNKFVFAVVDRLIDEITPLNYNFIVESAMKTPNTAFQNANSLKPLGYRVEVAIMGTDKDTAWKGTIDRYESAKEKYESGIKAGKTDLDPPRPVDREFFNLVLEGIENSFAMVYKSENRDGEKQTPVDDITIFNRSGEIIYHMSDTPDMNPVPIMHARLYNSEMKSREIINDYIVSFQNSKLHDNMLETMGNDVDTYVKFLKFQGTMYKQNPKDTLDFYVQNRDIKFLATETQWQNLNCPIKSGEKAIKGTDRSGNSRELYDISQVETDNIQSPPKIWTINKFNAPVIKSKLNIDSETSLLNGIVNGHIEKNDIIDCVRKINVPKSQLNSFVQEYMEGVRCVIAGRLEFGGNQINGLTVTNTIFNTLETENKMNFISSISQSAGRVLQYVESIAINLNNENLQSDSMNASENSMSSFWENNNDTKYSEDIDNMVDKFREIADDVEDDYDNDFIR